MRRWLEGCGSFLSVKVQFFMIFRTRSSLENTKPKDTLQKVVTPNSGYPSKDSSQQKFMSILRSPLIKILNHITVVPTFMDQC